jgi:hypothetical protein
MPVNHWIIGTDHALLVEGLRDAVSGAAINDATITGSLRDAQGELVSGASAISFAYRAASSGDYVGTLSNAAALEENRPYTLQIIATAGSFQRTWRLTRTARHAGV